MEAARYVCEFFFDNLWHYLLLLLVCYVASRKTNVYKIEDKDKKDDSER